MTTTKQALLTARLIQVVERLVLYQSAETAILSGAQSYSIANRTITRADLKSIADQIRRLEKEQLKLLASGAIRVQRVVPRDL